MKKRARKEKKKISKAQKIILYVLLGIVILFLLFNLGRPVLRKGSEGELRSLGSLSEGGSNNMIEVPITSSCGSDDLIIGPFEQACPSEGSEDYGENGEGSVTCTANIPAGYCGAKIDFSYEWTIEKYQTSSYDICSVDASVGSESFLGLVNNRYTETNDQTDCGAYSGSDSKQISGVVTGGGSAVVKMEFYTVDEKYGNEVKCGLSAKPTMTGLKCKEGYKCCDLNGDGKALECCDVCGNPTFKTVSKSIEVEGTFSNYADKIMALKEEVAAEFADFDECKEPAGWLCPPVGVPRRTKCKKEMSVENLVTITPIGVGQNQESCGPKDDGTFYQTAGGSNKDEVGKELLKKVLDELQGKMNNLECPPECSYKKLSLTITDMGFDVGLRWPPWGGYVEGEYLITCSTGSQKWLAEATLSKRKNCVKK